MSRFGYVDIYKCIGIILMIMGHIGFGDCFDFFIHAFHMPMFFFISGFLYNNKNNVCLNQVIILLISNFLNFTFLFKNCLILILSVIMLNICSYVISNTRLKFLVGRC